MDYNLTRSKRKTVTMYVRDSIIDVRAPLRMPKRDIDSFVASKEKWIKDRLSQTKEQAKRRGSFNLSYGDMVLYRGELCPIEQRVRGTVLLTHSDKHVFSISCQRDGSLDTKVCQENRPPDTSDEIKAACIRLYKKLAKQDITERVQYFAERMFVEPTAIKINSAKTRWGSCSSKKSLNFSWRLIMADDYVIDYVVVHELAHIYEMNHSTRFWAIVQSILPDYKARQKQLKELQEKLAGEDWECRK